MHYCSIAHPSGSYKTGRSIVEPILTHCSDKYPLYRPPNLPNRCRSNDLYPAWYHLIYILKCQRGFFGGVPVFFWIFFAPVRKSSCSMEQAKYPVSDLQGIKHCFLFLPSCSWGAVRKGADGTRIDDNFKQVKSIRLKD